MALTEKQKVYYKAYREANREAIRAHQKRWYDVNGKDNREQRVETVRENARAYYHRSKDSDRAREYVIANKEKRAAYYAQWQKDHREELNEYNRKRWFKDAYPEVVGIPESGPPDACEICGSTKSVCLDHCHKTNAFRGWLCRGCNARVEHPHTSKKYRERILVYLEQFQKRQQVVTYSA